MDLDLQLVIVSHDFGLVAAHADDIAVMHGGRVVEHGTVAEVLARPSHPHLRDMLACAPSLDGPLRPWHAVLGERIS